MTIMPAFSRYHQEGMIVGRLLAGYGELEFSLCHCVAVAIGNLDVVLKAMFRARGEKDRVDIADALGRPAYRKFRLETQFSEAVAATHYCRQIRNQFAHCHWHYDNTGRLGFVKLPEIAHSSSVADIRKLTIHHIDLALLQEQETYFEFTSECLSYLNFEAQKREGRLYSNPFSAPRKLKRPQFCTP